MIAFLCSFNIDTNVCSISNFAFAVKHIDQCHIVDIFL